MEKREIVSAANTYHNPDACFPQQRTYRPSRSGSDMIVWGGFGTINPLSTGRRHCAQAGSPSIMLSAENHKGGRINAVQLDWRKATSSEIDVYRDGALIASTPNDGFYIDSTGDTGRARYNYQVWEAGTQTCSNEATVTFPR